MIKHAHCNLVLRHKFAAQSQDLCDGSQSFDQSTYAETQDFHLQAKARMGFNIPMVAPVVDV